MNAKAPVIFAILILAAIPMAMPCVDSAGTHIGGYGHGDGIDVEYTEGDDFVVLVSLSSRPSGDVRVSILSVDTTQSVGPVGAAKVFGVFVDRLQVGTYTLMVTLASNNTLIAQCELIVGSAYYAYYDSNGGRGVMMPGVSENDQITLRDNSFFAPSGMSFKAWSVGGKEYSPGQKIAVTDDLAVKAVWKEGTDPSPGSLDNGILHIAIGVVVVLILLLLLAIVLSRRGKRSSEDSS